MAMSTDAVSSLGVVSTNVQSSRGSVLARSGDTYNERRPRPEGGGPCDAECLRGRAIGMPKRGRRRGGGTGGFDPYLCTRRRVFEI